MASSSTLNVSPPELEQPNGPTPLESSRVLMDLNQRIRECKLCEHAGYIPEARPVVADGGRHSGVVLIGQAPGIVEFENLTPFGGRAGRTLFRWLSSIGIEEAEFRANVYMGAVTRCFPGRRPGMGGDRRPSNKEIASCRPWLESVLQLLQPKALLLLGTLAIEPYLPGQPLDTLVGKRFVSEGAILVPLPHPSGASRWLNAPNHRHLLDQALLEVQEVWSSYGLGAASTCD